MQRLFTWLCAQVDKLLQRLGVVKPVTQQPAPASGAAQPAQPVSAAPATPGAGTPSRSTAGRPAALAADKPGHPHVATGHRSDAEKARWKAVSDREFAICSIPGGEERLLAEESKIRGGSSRPLSLEERESVASTVVAWIREGVRVDVDHVIGETCTEVGFTPPVQVWWAVGHQLQGGYVPDTRPGLLVSTLKTLLERTGAAPTDEEQTLRAALDEQRRAKAEERYQKALDVYRRDLQVWKDSGGWLRPRGWSKPKKPPKPEPVPPSQEQIEKFRQNLIYKMTSFVRGRIEQMFDLRERARPLRPGEGPAARPSVIAYNAPQQRQQPDRDDDGPSR